MNEEIKPIEERKQDPGVEKQATILIIIFIILAIILASFFLFKGSNKDHFVYNNLEFYKINDSNLTWYTTNVTVNVKNRSADYLFYFRIDPRKTGKISFKDELNIFNKSYVSFSSESLSCEAANLVGWNLGDFLGRMGSKVSAGRTEKNDSNDTVKIINCSTDLNATTIILKANNSKSRIYLDKNNPNCIILEAKDCEIIEISERFIIKMLSDLQIEKI